MSQVLVNADTVLGGLNNISSEYGITLSDYLTSPWVDAAARAQEFKNSAINSANELLIQNGIFTGQITEQINSMFGAGSLAANNFVGDIQDGISTIKTNIENNQNAITTSLKSPYETTTNYAKNTFSPQVQSDLQAVADKAHTLSPNETNDIVAPLKAGKDSANTFGDTANKVLDDVAKKAVDTNPSLTTDLTTPPYAANYAWGLFGGTVKQVFSDMIIAATTAASQVGSKMTDIINKAKEAAAAIAGAGSATSDYNARPTPSHYQTQADTPTSGESVRNLQEALNIIFNAGLVVDGKWGSKTETALKAAQALAKAPRTGKYDAATRTALIAYVDKMISDWERMGGSSAIGQGVARLKIAKKLLPAAFYAKGTLGTDKDQWAITDEIGDELTMYATPEGKLSFMRVGSTVVPHDLTKELINIGEVGLDGLINMPKFNSGINLMSNYINKPEIKLDIGEFVHVDRVDRDTLPEFEKLIDKKIDNLTKQLNYSIKKFSR